MYFCLSLLTPKEEERQHLQFLACVEGSIVKGDQT